MSSAITAGGTVNYLYNGLNQRARKTGPTALVPTGAAYYLYDEAGQLLGEYDANGAPLYETIYLGSLPVGVMQQTGTAATNDIAVSLYNLHADHIATPRVITRQDQTIVWRWDTAEAFGGTAPNQNPSGLGAFVYNPRFPGQVFDAETGLFQNWNREYSSRQGRYIQSDPIGLQGGINTFAYVEGNPLSYSDPLGLDAAGQAVGGAIGTWGGRIVGGAIGTLIEPGGGTAVGAVAGGAIGGRVGGAIGSAIGDAVKGDECPPDNSDRCEKAKQDARSRYSKLTTKRIPQYLSGGTNGPDPGHYAAILQLQQSLRDAIRRIKLYCSPLPLELPQWEQAANQTIAPQH